MIRVVVVDDQPVVRSGIVRILGPDDGFEVVAECGDGDEVVPPSPSTPRPRPDGRSHAPDGRRDGDPGVDR